MRHARLRWIEIRSPDADNFAEWPRGYEEIALLIESDPCTVGIDLFSRDLARFDPPHRHRLRSLRIDAKDIARDPIRQVEPALSVGGDAFDDHGAVRAGGIEVN